MSFSLIGHLARTETFYSSGERLSLQLETCRDSLIQFLTVLCFIVLRLIALTEELLYKRCKVDSLEHIVVSKDSLFPCTQNKQLCVQRGSVGNGPLT